MSKRDCKDKDCGCNPNVPTIDGQYCVGVGERPNFAKHGKFIPKTLKGKKLKATAAKQTEEVDVDDGSWEAAEPLDSKPKVLPKRSLKPGCYNPECTDENCSKSTEVEPGQQPTCTDSNCNDDTCRELRQNQPGCGDPNCQDGSCQQPSATNRSANAKRCTDPACQDPNCDKESAVLRYSMIGAASSVILALVCYIIFMQFKKSRVNSSSLKRTVLEL